MLALALTTLLAAAPAGPFPLPSIDGKPLAVVEGQKVFRLPMRFEKARSFFEEQLKTEGVSVVRKQGSKGRVLAIVSKRKDDDWTRAEVAEGESETVVTVTQVIRAGPMDVDGKAPRPLVQFIIGRNADAADAAKNIDHMNSMMKR